MKININSIVHFFSREPRKLFLVDGWGAALTTFSLFFVLRPYHDYIGLPTNILIWLSVIGLVYGAFSISCYFLRKDNWAPYLRIIGIGNFLYCILTMTLLIFYHNTVTPLGWIYFLAEIFVIVLLVYIEWRTASRLSVRKTD